MRLVDDAFFWGGFVSFCFVFFTFSMVFWENYWVCCWAKGGVCLFTSCHSNMSGEMQLDTCTTHEI